MGFLDTFRYQWWYWLHFDSLSIWNLLWPVPLSVCLFYHRIPHRTLGSLFPLWPLIQASVVWAKLLRFIWITLTTRKSIWQASAKVQGNRSRLKATTTSSMYSFSIIICSFPSLLSSSNINHHFLMLIHAYLSFRISFLMLDTLPEVILLIILATLAT